MATQAESELSKHGWRLVKMGSNDALRSTSPEFRVTLSFEQGRAYGASACNRYFTSYSLLGEFQLQFHATGSTQMMCSEAAMLLEGEYFAALEHVETYQLQADQLILLYEQGKSRMLFIREEQEK